MGDVDTLASQWGVPVGAVNQIEQLADLWEKNVGFAFQVPDDALKSMLQQGFFGSGEQIRDEYMFGQYMYAAAQKGLYGVDFNQLKQTPWASVGTSQQEYRARSSSLNAVYKELTGKDAPQLEIDRAFGIGGGYTSPSDYRSNLMSDAEMQKTYGWLKFGMNYQEFQRQKADYRTSFGGDLSDEQAINQLKYDHALGHVLGAYQTAQLQPDRQFQQQQGAEPPGAGISGSVVR